MKIALYLLTGITSLLMSHAFHIPILGSSVELKRHSILDLPHFTNHTHDSISGLTFATFKTINPKKPTALFIPGLEFSSLSLSQHIDDMRDNFNLVYTCLNNIATPSVENITQAISQYIRQENLTDVVVIGESTGAILALNVALNQPISDAIQGTVLLNSATAYRRSTMEEVINLGRHIWQWEYKLGVILFLAVQKCDVNIFDYSRSRILVMMLINLLLFPRVVLIERVDTWIVDGCRNIADKLSTCPIPTLIVASKKDEMFCSVNEAKRLNTLLPNSKIIYVANGGHLITSDQLPLCKVIQKHLQ